MPVDNHFANGGTLSVLLALSVLTTVILFAGLAHYGSYADAPHSG